MPVGVFLSGGTDSFALVALVSEVREEAPRTFSVVCDEEGLSESSTHARSRCSATPCQALAGRFGGPAGDLINEVFCLELMGYMRNILLRDADMMSMAASLELRVPFLDHELVEMVTSAPGALKVADDHPKPLLVSGLAESTPSMIVNRPKQGFTLPLRPGCAVRCSGKSTTPLQVRDHGGRVGQLMAGERSDSHVEGLPRRRRPLVATFGRFMSRSHGVSSTRPEAREGWRHDAMVPAEWRRPAVVRGEASAVYSSSPGTRMRTRRGRIAAPTVAAIAVAAIAGCGGADIRREAVGDDAARLPFRYDKPANSAGSPADTVMELLHVAASGALPAVPEYYAERTRRAVGASALAGVLGQLRPAILDGGMPKVLQTSRVRGGTLVSISFPKPVQGSLQHGFFLKHQGGRWTVTYDTLVATAVAQYVQTTVQGRVAPGAVAPSAAAVRAAALADAAFRDAALGGVEDQDKPVSASEPADRSEPPAEEPEATATSPATATPR